METTAIISEPQAPASDEFYLLRESGLLEQGLLRIDDPHLVERYNQCLTAIGLEPTTLSGFSIDSMGFSPEIAAEKMNLQYLSLDGISNPFAIIISPEQKGLPVYAPYHSFDSDMMDEVFRSFHRQIADLTLRTGIYIDIDEGLARIAMPKDLLMLEWVKCRFHVIGNISEDAKRQRELVSLLHKEENWAETSLIVELIKNIEANGDLRYEQLQLTSLPFTDIRTFYTSSFGGVYVFRDITPKGEPIIVLEDPSGQADPPEGCTEYLIADPDLKKNLIKHKLIDFEPAYYGDAVRLERLCECLFIEAVFRHDENINVKKLTDAQLRKLELNLIKNEILDSHYEELRNLMRLSKRQRVTELKEASDEMKMFLMHPHKKIRGLARFVVHRLLTQINPLNIHELYVFARDAFLKSYLQWPHHRREWAVEFLKTHYELRNRSIFAKPTLDKSS